MTVKSFLRAVRGEVPSRERPLLESDEIERQIPRFFRIGVDDRSSARHCRLKDETRQCSALMGCFNPRGP